MSQIRNSLRAAVVGLALFTMAACGSDDDSNVPVDAPSPTATEGSSPAATPPPSALVPTENSPTCLDGFDATVDYFPDKVSVEYATEWQVQYQNHYKVLTVLGTVVGEPETVEEKYVLVQCGAPTPTLEGELAGAVVIEIPVERVVEAGGGTYGAFEALGVADRIVGWRNPPGGVEHSPSIANRAGEIEPIGDYGSSPEPMVALTPDLVITYESSEVFRQYRALGLPVVYYSPFTESPLGSAEQLKWLSLFLNQERAANDQFAEIESRYNELTAAANAQAGKPTVIIGSVSTAGTFGTGRFNPLAKHSALVRDAGGIDLMEPFYEQGQTFSQVPLEQAIATAADADFWYHQAYDPSAETAEEFLALNPQNGAFEALQAGRAFHRFARSEDFFATGGVRADWLLEDLVSILHPELLPGHELRFLKPIRP